MAEDEEIFASSGKSLPGEYHIPASPKSEKPRKGKTLLSEKLQVFGEKIYRKLRRFPKKIDKMFRTANIGSSVETRYPIIVERGKIISLPGIIEKEVKWHVEKRSWITRRRILVPPTMSAQKHGIVIDYQPGHKGGKIAILPTMIHAALKGRIRPGKVMIKRDDIRMQKNKVFSRLSLMVILDASLSMKFILSEILRVLVTLKLAAWRKRDKISLITCAGNDATVIVYPTTNINIVKRRFSRIKIGGSTPLASGMLKALRILNLEKIKNPEIIPVLLIISDGLANVPLPTMIPENIYDICPIKGFADALYVAYLIRKKKIPTIILNPFHDPREKRVLGWSPGLLLQKIAEITNGIYIGIPSKISRKAPDKVLNTIFLAINKIIEKHVH